MCAARRPHPQLSGCRPGASANRDRTTRLARCQPFKTAQPHPVEVRQGGGRPQAQRSRRALRDRDHQGLCGLLLARGQCPWLLGQAQPSPAGSILLPVVPLETACGRECRPEFTSETFSRDNGFPATEAGHPRRAGTPVQRAIHSPPGCGDRSSVEEPLFQEFHARGEASCAPVGSNRIL